MHFDAAEQLVSFIDLCFDCNNFESTPAVNVKHMGNRWDGEACLARTGFNETAWQALRGMCDQSGVGQCPPAGEGMDSGQ